MKIISKKSIPLLGLGILLSGQTHTSFAKSTEIRDSLTTVDKSICDSLLSEFKERRKIKDFVHGEKLLLEALKHCPDNSSYWGKLALNYFEAADNTYSNNKPLKKENKIILFEKGLEAARVCAQKDSLNKDAYEYMSMGFAGKLSLSSYRQQAILADSVRIYAEKSVAVDPQNDRAYHILGRWHYEVANLNWLIKLFSEVFIGVAPNGSYETAFTYFQKAVEINDYPIHHYWLGLDYLKLGKMNEAQEAFKKSIIAKGGHHNDDFFRDLSSEILKNKFN